VLCIYITYHACAICDLCGENQSFMWLRHLKVMTRNISCGWIDRSLYSTWNFHKYSRFRECSRFDGPFLGRNSGLADIFEIYHRRRRLMMGGRRHGAQQSTGGGSVPQSRGIPTPVSGIRSDVHASVGKRAKRQRAMAHSAAGPSDGWGDLSPLDRWV